MNWGRGCEDSCDLLVMGSEQKGKPQQVICYRTGDKTRGNRRRDEDLLLAYLLSYVIMS